MTHVTKLSLSVTETYVPGNFMVSSMKKVHDCYLNFMFFFLADILDGDVKSMLDILWLIILNYGIHSIGKGYCPFIQLIIVQICPLES